MREHEIAGFRFLLESLDLWKLQGGHTLFDWKSLLLLAGVMIALIFTVHSPQTLCLHPWQLSTVCFTAHLAPWHWCLLCAGPRGQQSKDLAWHRFLLHCPDGLYIYDQLSDLQWNSSIFLDCFTSALIMQDIDSREVKAICIFWYQHRTPSRIWFQSCPICLPSAVWSHRLLV